VSDPSLFLFFLSLSFTIAMYVGWRNGKNCKCPACGASRRG